MDLKKLWPKVRRLEEAQAAGGSGYIEGKTIHTIDPKFLPEGIGGSGGYPVIDLTGVDAVLSGTAITDETIVKAIEDCIAKNGYILTVRFHLKGEGESSFIFTVNFQHFYDEDEPGALNMWFYLCPFDNRLYQIAKQDGMWLFASMPAAGE